MGNNVFANGREISCKAADGKSICAFPDVCFTPPENPATPPGVPIPYPNTGMAKDTTSGTKKVKISGKEVIKKNKSYFKKSIGDEAGSAAKKGVITSTNRGKVYFNSWSMDVKFEGKNVVRHLDLTTHNHASIPGDTPPWPYLDSMAIDIEKPEGEEVKKDLDKKDENRKPPNGPIDYKNSKIAGEDVSNRILSSPPDGDFIWVQLMDGSFKFASRPILTDGRPAGLKPFPHPMLSKGEKVRSAGEGFGKDGKTQYINRDSGHFQPSHDSLEKAAKEMKKQEVAEATADVDTTNPLARDGSTRRTIRTTLEQL